MQALYSGGSGNTDYSPTEGAVVNEDGSYHLEDDNYEGDKLAVDVYAPEGLEMLKCPIAMRHSQMRITRQIFPLLALPHMRMQCNIYISYFFNYNYPQTSDG